MLALGSVRHFSERHSPTLVLTRAIVLEQQHSATDDNDAMDIGLIEALQPFDKSIKRLALEAGTLRFGDFPVRKTHAVTRRERAVEESRSCNILKLDCKQCNPQS